MGTRTALPVLQGLLCEVSGNNLKVTGTDLDMTVRTQTQVEVMEEGRAVIPGRLLSEAVRKMPAGQVTIGVSDTDIEIQGNGPRFTLRPLAVDDFPTQDEVVTDGVEVDGESFAEAINQVVVAASGDGARPILTGMPAKRLVARSSADARVGPCAAAPREVGPSVRLPPAA